VTFTRGDRQHRVELKSQKQYEAGGFRVEIDQGVARVYRFFPLSSEEPAWNQVAGSPYHLPALDFELANPQSYLSQCVYVYELISGRRDLRDALTGHGVNASPLRSIPAR